MPRLFTSTLTVNNYVACRPFFVELSWSPPLFLSRLLHTYRTLYLLFTITMLLHDLVRSKADSKLSFQEKEILSKILFKKNSTAETRDYSELVQALRIWTRDLQIFSLTLSQLSYLGNWRLTERNIIFFLYTIYILSVVHCLNMCRREASLNFVSVEYVE